MSPTHHGRLGPGRTDAVARPRSAPSRVASSQWALAPIPKDPSPCLQSRVVPARSLRKGRVSRCLFGTSQYCLDERCNADKHRPVTRLRRRASSRRSGTSSIKPRRSQRFPPVTVEFRSVCSHTTLEGVVVQEFHVVFSNNRPLHKVALIARCGANRRADSPAGTLEASFASSPIQSDASWGRATSTPIEILAFQSRPAILVFGMCRSWASSVAQPMAAHIEIEDCITKRRVRIVHSGEQREPLHLDELPLVEEGAYH
jgi:hypothetical protein